MEKKLNKTEKINNKNSVFDNKKYIILKINDIISVLKVLPLYCNQQVVGSIPIASSTANTLGKRLPELFYFSR